jgi:HPt (histidine-containing phosphotransfer) domain-containing protein
LLSDEFLRVAKKEISDDIAKISTLLQNCHDDNAVSKNIAQFEKHIHKIKGLAPMMGHDQIGRVAALVDGLLKSMLAGSSVRGIHSVIKKSHEFMQNTLDGANPDFELLKTEVERITKVS